MGEAENIEWGPGEKIYKRQSIVPGDRMDMSPIMGDGKARMREDERENNGKGYRAG